MYGRKRENEKTPVQIGIYVRVNRRKYENCPYRRATRTGEKEKSENHPYG